MNVSKYNDQLIELDKKHYFTQNKMYFDNYKNLKSYKSTSGQNSIIVFAKLF